MLSHEESRDMHREAQDRKLFTPTAQVAATFVIDKIWFLAGQCPFERGDTMTRRGVTYVVTGFSGCGNHPITACEVRPISEVLK